MTAIARMKSQNLEPTGVEQTFSSHEFIVSKTDKKGFITYVNSVFQRVSGYKQAKLIGKQHNIVRHPDMPRCVFKLLWDTLAKGDEIFAYVKNMCANGDHYWVFAHVTPSYNHAMELVGYHSCRRVPDRNALRVIEPLYEELLKIECQAPSPRQGMENSLNHMLSLLNNRGSTYEEFVFNITHH